MDETIRAEIFWRLAWRRACQAGGVLAKRPASADDWQSQLNWMDPKNGTHGALRNQGESNYT